MKGTFDAIGWLWFLLPLGVGVIPLREYRFAKISFVVSGLLLGGKIVRWISSSQIPARTLIVFVVCGMLGVLVMKSFAWVDSKRNEDTAQSSKAEQHPPKSSQPPSQQQSNSGGTNIQQSTSGANSPNISGNNNRVVYYNTDPKLSKAIEKLIEAQQGAQANPEKLLEKYPLGYTIFNVGYSNSVYPYASKKVLNEWNLDLNSAEITQVGGDEIRIKLPDFSWRGTKFVGATFIKPNTVGPIFGKAMIQLDDVIMNGEVLAVSDKGVVVLVGFKKDKPE